MSVVPVWSGNVDCANPDGTATGITLKKGDVISILSKGWVHYSKSSNAWAAPQGTINSDNTTLRVKLGNAQYPIGNGVYGWDVPEDGELVFFFADNIYTDNSGSFTVDVYKNQAVGPATTTSHEQKGIQSDNQFTFQLPPGQQFGVTTLINTGAPTTVNLYADNTDTLLYSVEGSGYPNKTYSGICSTGSSGKVKVEILSNGKPVKSTKFAYQIFDKEPGVAVFAAEDGTDNDYNDAIVILNWPLG